MKSKMLSQTLLSLFTVGFAGWGSSLYAKCEGLKQNECSSNQNKPTCEWTKNACKNKETAKAEAKPAATPAAQATNAKATPATPVAPAKAPADMDEAEDDEEF